MLGLLFLSLPNLLPPQSLPAEARVKVAADFPCFHSLRLSTEHTMVTAPAAAAGPARGLVAAPRKNRSSAPAPAITLKGMVMQKSWRKAWPAWGSLLPDEEAADAAAICRGLVEQKRREEKARGWVRAFCMWLAPVSLGIAMLHVAASGSLELRCLQRS